MFTLYRLKMLAVPISASDSLTLYKLDKHRNNIAWIELITEKYQAKIVWRLWICAVQGLPRWRPGTSATQCVQILSRYCLDIVWILSGYCLDIVRILSSRSNITKLQRGQNWTYIQRLTV